jgi:hypothetical protein
VERRLKSSITIRKCGQITEGYFNDITGKIDYSGDIFDCIRQLSKTESVSVSLFKCSEDSKYDQFVISNGELYRTESLDGKMT